MPKRSYNQMMLRTPPNTPNTRARTGVLTRSMARDIAASAVHRAVGSVVPYYNTARTVYNAARTIQSAWRKYQGRSGAKQQQKTQSSSRRVLQFGSKYAGRFRKPKKGSRISMAKKIGCVVSHEMYGQIKDPDLVCIGHHTTPIPFIAKAVAIALLRKVLKRAINFDGNDVTKEIPVTDYNDSANGVILLIWKNATDNANLTQQIDIAANKSINDLTSQTTTGSITYNLIVTLERVFLNTSNYGELELDRVLYKTNGRVVCDINMYNEVIKLFVSSSLKLQNRTFAAGEANASTDRVDTQPLKGKCLKFVGVPKLKDSAVNVNSLAPKYDLIGTILVRGAELGTLEPFVKQDFSNAYASAGARLGPGEIKYSKLSMKKSFYFNNMLKVLQSIANNNTYSKFPTPGYTEMFQFEELLNSGSTNPIHVQYEQQLYISTYCFSGGSNSMRTIHTQDNKDNVPA